MIVLVNPNDRKPMSVSAVEPPIWLGMMATQWGDVTVIDAEAEGLSPPQTRARIMSYDPDYAHIVVMGINPSASSTPKMAVVRELVRGLECPVVLSGLHPQAVGEGFNTYEFRPQDTMPSVAWDLLPMDKYRAHNWHCLGGIPRQPYAVIYTSLGCPFNCHFCNIHTLYNGQRKVWYRKPEDVIAEIDLLVNKYKVKNIKIWDELFTLNKNHVHTICDLIIERGYNLNIWAYARVGTVDMPLLRKMKQAGINWLCYGFESFSPAVRQGVDKNYDNAHNAIEMTRRAGINILGNFIFGLPNDNLESMMATLSLAKWYNFEFVNFYVAMAYPGSKLYEDAVEQGLPLPKTWDAYGQFSPDIVPLPTKHLTGAKVLEFRDNAFMNYFSNPRYLEMIDEKFGAVNEIKEMLKWKPKRNILKQNM